VVAGGRGLGLGAWRLGWVIGREAERYAVVMGRGGEFSCMQGFRRRDILRRLEILVISSEHFV
jgi:hypothetical protein